MGAFLKAADESRRVYPGLLLVGTVSIAASGLSYHYGAPLTLFALLLGMTFHFVHDDPRCASGIEFSSKILLRVGVALMGLRISLAQILALGWLPIVIVPLGVVTTVGLGILLARRFGLSRAFGLLSGGAVGICGASAALALSAAMPARVRERETVLTVVIVTSLSTMAMIIYPLIARATGLQPTLAGIFFGGTIHDVAQVVGAASAVSTRSGDIAVYVKLLRVAALVPVVLAVTLAGGRRGQETTAPAPIPLFLVGFVVLMMLNSVGAVSTRISDAASDVSRWCLAMAIAAIGIKTSFAALARSGWKPVMLMVIETVWLALLVLLAVCMFQYAA